MPGEESFTVAEVAKLWKCSKDFVYDRVSDGSLRSWNLSDGRAKTRIPASALTEYEKQRTRKPLRQVRRAA